VRFLDTNVILRYLTRDDPVKADACMRLLRRAEAGEEELMTSETVVSEIFYVLTRGRGAYRVDRNELVARVLPIVQARGLRLPEKGVVLRALAVYGTYRFLDFEDALSVAHMESAGIEAIVSFDRGFDRVPAVRRVEP
jgi:predicted nucleic acid-binding protein